jgi:arabinose-5-phosphate isomerase
MDDAKPISEGSHMPAEHEPAEHEPADNAAPGYTASSAASSAVRPPVSPAECVRIEADALLTLADRLEGAMAAPFAQASSRLTQAVRDGHRVVTTGVGKSGLIARKLAATLVSTGIPAQFLHPADALHGDLGVLQPGDVAIALSYSGETEELLRLLPLLPRLGVAMIAFCGCVTSTLARAAEVALDVAVDREACSHQLVPTASTTAMMALGDALALSVSHALGFQPKDFAELHPGGQLGRKLQRVEALMHAGPAMPQVSGSAAMPQIIHEMSAKRLGLTAVTDGTQLVGIISDGDLRRLFERNGPYAFHKTASDIMNTAPLTIAPGIFATEALVLMEQRKITVLPVTADGTLHSPLLGVIHLHDLWDVTPESKPANEPPADEHEASRYD